MKNFDKSRNKALGRIGNIMLNLDLQPFQEETSNVRIFSHELSVHPANRSHRRLTLAVGQGKECLACILQDSRMQHKFL